MFDELEEEKKVDGGIEEMNTLNEPEPEPEPDPESKIELDPKPEPEPTVPTQLEFDSLKGDNLTLRERIIKLEEGKVEPKIEQEPELKPDPIAEENFLGDLDLDELTRNPTEFNKLLNSVYKKGVETNRGEILGGSEKVLRSIPDIVKTNITLVENLRKASTEFYEDNEDLKPFNKIVGAVFEEETAKDPSKTYAEVLSKVGSEVRNRLNLQRKAEPEPEPKPNANPKLPRSKGTKIRSIKTDQPNTDPLLDELETMNKSLSL